MTLPSGISWSPGEAAAVHEFLSTPVGMKWLGVLLVRKPRLDLGSTEKAALSGAFAAGYEYMFSQIAATRVSMSQESDSAKAIDPIRD